MKRSKTRLSHRRHGNCLPNHSRASSRDDQMSWRVFASSIARNKGVRFSCACFSMSGVIIGGSTIIKEENGRRSNAHPNVIVTLKDRVW